MTPEESFITDLSIITHTYILECRKKNKELAPEIVSLVVAVLEAEVEILKGDT